LSKSTHEYRLVRKCTCEFLGPHHKATISSNTTDILFVNKVINCLLEFCDNIFCHVIGHAHAESVARHDSVVNVVVVRPRMINITRSCRVVIVESDDS